MLDVSDVDNFAQRLNNTPSPFVEEAWRSEWSEKVADEWRSNVPVDTGAYRDSIRVTDEGASSDARHAAYVEYGTNDTPPQPALLPAITRLTRPASEDLGRRLMLEF